MGEEAHVRHAEVAPALVSLVFLDHLDVVGYVCCVDMQLAFTGENGPELARHCYRVLGHGCVFIPVLQRHHITCNNETFFHLVSGFRARAWVGCTRKRHDGYFSRRDSA